MHVVIRVNIRVRVYDKPVYEKPVYDKPVIRVNIRVRARVKLRVRRA